MSEQYYALYLDDPASPSFCSFSKLYVGSETDMLRVAVNLSSEGVYEETANGIHAYFKGNTNVRHRIAYQEFPVLEPVDAVDSSEMQIGTREWVHINTWDCPYYMRCASARVSQLILRQEESFCRYIRVSFSDLKYSGNHDEWIPIGDSIWGNASVLDVQKNPDGSSVVGLILFVAEDSSDSLVELQKKMNDPNELVFNLFCDEIFGDG